MKELEKLLSGDDLRSIGNCNSVILKIKNQNDFDKLFEFLFYDDRIVVMHTADAIEKITIDNPEYLKKHKRRILGLFYVAKNKELKWHLALLIPRLHLDNKDFGRAWDTLMKWAKDKADSRLVRVGAIQGLYEMTKQKNNLRKEFISTLPELEKENIPSINARIRNIRKEIA